MEFSKLTSKEKFEYIITNYDKVIDSEAAKATYKFGFQYTKEEFKSSMYFYILTHIKYFKHLHGLGLVIGVNCRQAVAEHIKENTYNRVNYSYHIKKYKYEKEHNCTLETKEEVCKALGIRSETYDIHFNLKFNSIDAQIDKDDTSDRAKSMSEYLVDENINVENEVIDKILDNHNKLTKIINNCIDSLSEKESKIIRYRYFSNLSYEEIAKIENTSVKSVDNAIDRAKNNLRAMLLSKKHIEIVKNFI